MPLSDVLSQLAIFGATSILLRTGRLVELEHADALVAETPAAARFALFATAPWIIEILEVRTGRIFARAATLWRMNADALVAAGNYR